MVNIFSKYSKNGDNIHHFTKKHLNSRISWYWIGIL